MPSQSEMPALVAAHDWATSPLGPRESWPPSLRTAVDICLGSDLAMFVWWGPELINIHNDAYASVLGKRHPKALGQPAREIWQEIWPLIGDDVARVMNGEAVLKLHVPLILERNGYPEETWFTYSHSPIRDESGQVRGLFQVCVDETERVAAERYNKRLEDQARTTLDSMSDAFFSLDRDWRYTYTNRQNAEMVGKLPGELLGNTLWELFPSLLGGPFEPIYRGAMAGTAGSVTEFFPVHQRWYEVRAHPAPNGISVYVRDLTEKASAEAAEKRASERTNRLYEVAAALSNALTVDDVAQVAVHQGIAAVGAMAGSLALLSGDQLEIVAAKGFTTAAIQQWERFAIDAPIPMATAVRLGEPVFIESAEERAARFPAVLSLTANSVTRASACLPLSIGGRAVGALGLSFDRPGGFSPEDRDLLISLARQCAQALERARLFEGERRARTEAERASTMKDEFLATLSHELRTPLNAILGWSTVLSRRIPPGSDLHSGLEKIQRNAQAQTRIVEDLLDMSRIISGNLRLEVQRLDLTQVLNAALDTVRPAADAKGVRLQTVLDSQGGPVSGDPSRLQQVFWNLLNNAVKFTPRGGQVQLTMERVDSHVAIRVADTGEGISNAFLPHVFDRFRQADGSTTRRHGGLGLGLAIVKQLVELHGGNIRAKSPGDGQGSTFTIELPLAVLHAEPLEIKDLDRRVSVAAVLDETDVSLAGVRILVVDDEPDARALVKQLLEERSAQVTIAGSAAEAMELLLLERHDVLISDIGMPVEDGYGLIRRIRAHGTLGQIPAVALTAYARVDDRVKAIRAGFHSHVVKPVEAQELIAVVASLAGRIR